MLFDLILFLLTTFYRNEALPGDENAEEAAEEAAEGDGLTERRGGQDRRTRRRSRGVSDACSRCECVRFY